LALSDITADIERELSDDPRTLRELRDAHDSWKERYPKPSEKDVLSALERLRGDFSTWHNQIRLERDVRYLRAKMPEKWAKQLSIGTDEHIHSRLGHNMIMRVAAMATRNPPKFRVEPAGGKEDDKERSEKQTRWANNFWPAMERQKAKLRVIVDNQLGDGLGALLIYRTGAYDDMDHEMRDGETPKAYLRRTEEDFKRAGDPYGIRPIDPLSLMWDEDGDEVCTALIEQDVAIGVMDSVLKRRLSEKEYTEWRAESLSKRTGSPSWNTSNSDRPMDVAKCVWYYDKRWYAFFVDNKCVEGPVEHGFSFVPIVLYEGMTTGSPNRTERYQGVFWGMSGLEKAIDWLMTLDTDTAFTLSKPKVVITQPQGPNGGMRDVVPPGQNDAPPPLDFSNGNVPRLRPGEVPVNVTSQFVPFDSSRLRAEIMQLIQISGLNPIAQGESPGSDPAGYAINALQSAAQSMYEVALDNASRAHADLINKIRVTIRRDKLPWYLSGVMSNGRKGGTAWLGLSPDDIDETPIVCTIDPLSDVNRIAVQQARRQANKEGFISRWRVQEAHGIDDFEAEDEDIIEDTMEAELARMVIEEAKAEVMGTYMQPQQPASGLVDQYGNPLQSQPQGMNVGAVPAQMQPPSVGGAGAAGSAAPFETKSGPAPQSASSASAGQGSMSRVGA
jgi:hypothetical protein